LASDEPLQSKQVAVKITENKVVLTEFTCQLNTQ